MTTEDTEHLILHFDGSCWPNPGGPMGYGWHLDTEGGDRIADESGTVTGYPPNESTNNTAEFHALLAGLEWVNALRCFQVDKITFRGDSALVVNIVTGRWKAKKPHLVELADLCREEFDKLRRWCQDVEVEWVPREENQTADELSTASK